MLKTEHILYRSGTRLGIDAATTGTVYDAFTRVLHQTLLSGAAVELGSIGFFFIENGQLLHSRSAEGKSLQHCDVKDIVTGLKDDTNLSLELVQRFIEDVFLQAIDAMERRESTELRAIGVWSPESYGSGMQFRPALITDTNEGETHAAVDVRRVVATVHSELGYTPPADTVDPSGIDFATLVRLVRNNMPDLPSSPVEPARFGTADAADSPAAVPEISADTGVSIPDFDTLSGSSTESDVFEFNREQLYHPPAQARRPLATSMAVVVVLVVFALLGYLAWTNGLLDSILPDAYDHGNVVRQSSFIRPVSDNQYYYSRGGAMCADRLNRPSFSWSII